MNKEFHTFREYMKKDEDLLTASMEDYLEMIYRLSRETGYTRINDLSAALNVQPPSATRMVQKLAEIGTLDYEKYGVIVLSPKGKKLGEYLLVRHQMVEDFLKMLGITEDILMETEKIEHTISTQTLKCLADFVDFFKHRPEVLSDFVTFRKTRGKTG
ncbi:transcriptional regulator MntR [Pelotomaculum propionicicum]|uniref:Manganese transport regulator n=1 Tax=Pelotomaculum propionicicum TaxID=258475 RepID=A0A4Y7RJD0_9FIRM|nr:transcriptional regulator MntR [Pelotomaculum propionicicum]TEB08829.1 Transcriptional regulator MntR [Pelotomaculum propionicicum]